MKHKAQESFEHMTKHIDLLHWLYNHEIIQENYENDKELMQEFINCQLNEYEIEAFKMFCEKGIEVAHIEEDALSETVFGRMLDKLIKQEEMWVEE